jgi:hypothetical protein
MLKSGIDFGKKEEKTFLPYTSISSPLRSWHSPWPAKSREIRLNAEVHLEEFWIFMGKKSLKGSASCARRSTSAALHQESLRIERGARASGFFHAAPPRAAKFRLCSSDICSCVASCSRDANFRLHR